ncbi:MAG: DUF58 domain-containing protein [Planctomycetales bacterium]
MPQSLPITARVQPQSGQSATPAGAIDTASLMRIQNLQLRAKVVVEGFLSGMHKSPYHGFSVEFTEYRQYSPGDDLRYLDWRLYARSDRYYLKRFEDETNLRCWLLVDLSRSMGFRSLEYDKATYARTAAATIAHFLSLQRDAVGLVTFDQTIREFLPARFRPGHLRRLMMCLEHSPGGAATDLVTPLEQIVRTARKRGLVVLLSDLLAPVEALQTRLGWLRSRGHEIVILRVLDPAEIDFRFRDESLFFDLESGRELYVDPQAARASYLEKFQAHQQALAEACRDLGIDLYQLNTAEPLDQALFNLLHARQRRTRQAPRRRAARPGSSGRGAP